MKEFYLRVNKEIFLLAGESCTMDISKFGAFDWNGLPEIDLVNDFDTYIDEKGCACFLCFYGEDMEKDVYFFRRVHNVSNQRLFNVEQIELDYTSVEVGK